MIGQFASIVQFSETGLRRTEDTMSTFIDQNEPVAGNHGAPRPSVEPGASAPSQLGSTIRIEGNVYAQQDLFVDGEVNGSVIIPGHQVSIGARGNVKADIKAKSVVLVGALEGKIEASERIELRSGSSLIGDVRGRRIVVENGALIKGTVEVLR